MSGAKVTPLTDQHLIDAAARLRADDRPVTNRNMAAEIGTIAECADVARGTIDRRLWDLRRRGAL